MKVFQTNPVSCCLGKLLLETPPRMFLFSLKYYVLHHSAKNIFLEILDCSKGERCLSKDKYATALMHSEKILNHINPYQFLVWYKIHMEQFRSYQYNTSLFVVQVFQETNQHNIDWSIQKLKHGNPTVDWLNFPQHEWIIQKPEIGIDYRC